MSLKHPLLVAAGLLAALPATAQTPSKWVAGPTRADVAAAYPARAKAANVGGTVNLSCTIERSGRVHDCAVMREAPTGYGFGNAARGVAEHLRTDAGARPGDDMRVVVTFAPEVLSAGPLVITHPAWDTLPSAEDFQASFPKTENGVNDVRVVMACTAQASGSLTDCAIESETPAGQGYGQGALALAPKFKVGPWSADGQPTQGARVRVPIHYTLKQVEAEAAKR